MVKVKISERQILTTVKKLAQTEFEEKKPNRVEIRRVKTLAIFQEKVRSVMDWVKYLSRYILVVYYPTSIRVYFLTKIGHMQAAMDFPKEEFKEIESLLKRKTKLIYAIKEITPHIPTTEELAQYMLDRITKYLKSAIERTGVSLKNEMPIIKVVDKRPEDVGFFGCRFEGKTIQISKKMCSEPLSNYVAQYISYLILVPRKILTENPDLAVIIASSVLRIFLTQSEIEEFFAFYNKDCNYIPLNKRKVKYLYQYLELVSQYEQSKIRDEFYLNSFSVLFKELNPYLGLVELFKLLYTDTKNELFILKMALSYYLTSLERQASETLKQAKAQDKIDWLVVNGILNYRIGFVHRNIVQVSKNIYKILNDALEKCEMSAFEWTISKISPPSEETNNLLILRAVLRNKTDLNCTNVRITIGKWIPKTALQLVEPPKEIDYLAHDKAVNVEIGFSVQKTIDVKISYILASGICPEGIQLSGKIIDIKIVKQQLEKAKE